MLQVIVGSVSGNNDDLAVAVAVTVTAVVLSADEEAVVGAPRT